MLQWAKTRSVKLDYPDLEWFHYWILVSDWCVSEEVFERKKEYLIEHFGGKRKFERNTWNAFLSWGEGLAQQRREEGEPFPPSSDRASVIAALDRLTGYDQLDELIASAFQKKANAKRAASVSLSGYMTKALMMHVFYPNDEVIYLNLTPSWLKVAREQRQQGVRRSKSSAPAEDLSFVAAVLFGMLAGLIPLRVLRIVTIRWLGWLLVIRDRPEYHRYEEHYFRSWSSGLYIFVMPPLTWFVARYFLEPFFVFYILDEFSLFLVVAVSSVIGGALIEAIDHIVSMITIRLGHDPAAIILDNLIAAVLGGLVLWYFQNSWFSIAAALSVGLVLSLALKLKRAWIT